MNLLPYINVKLRVVVPILFIFHIKWNITTVLREGLKNRPSFIWFLKDKCKNYI